MSEFPSQNQDKFVLRLPDGMRNRIKAASVENNRSMNAEIIATLEDKYPAPAVDEELMVQFMTYFLGVTREAKDLSKFTKQQRDQIETMLEKIGEQWGVSSTTVLSEFSKGLKLAEQQLSKNLPND